MERNKISINGKLTQCLTIGGISLVVFGASYYFLKRSKERKQKELILTILKETRKELFPFLKEIIGKKDTIPKDEWLDMSNTESSRHLLLTL